MKPSKHVWHDPRPDNVHKLMSEEIRVCELCGAVQTLEVRHWYMRTIGKRWRPLVGRCKGRKAETML